MAQLSTTMSEVKEVSALLIHNQDWCNCVIPHAHRDTAFHCNRRGQSNEKLGWSFWIARLHLFDLESGLSCVFAFLLSLCCRGIYIHVNVGHYVNMMRKSCESGVRW